MDDPNLPMPAAAEAAADDRCPHCGQPVGDAWLVCAWCGEHLAAPAELAVGSSLGDGRYEILRVIGRGGFGITYEAGDRRLMRRVAIKELFPDFAVRHGSKVLTPPHARPGFRGARDRFIREARVLARFSHPGIVRVFEVFEEHGTAYLVMELLTGRTLVEVLRERDRPFTEAEVLDVAGRVAAALRPVHAAGVLHRDLNPSNVMLTDHGRIVLIDFGLARDFDRDHTQGMTRVVTPGYAPLEQYRGEARFGPPTDVYGLAATCYRLATGTVPTPAIDRDGGAELVAPHRLNPAISKALSDGILDGLELEPGHRPQDLDAFLARLGVRRLPEGPRSILLGTEGATFPAAGIATEVVLPAAEVPSPPLAPAPQPLEDPGPAVPARGATGGPRSAPVGAAIPLAELDGTAVSPVDRTDLGADRTDVDPDRTRPELSGAGAIGLGAASDDPDATLHVDRTATGALLGATAATAPGGPADDRPRPRSLMEAAGHPPGWRAVTVPLAVVAVATGSAAPVLVTALVVLVVLPLLATLGDSAAHQQRAQAGIAGGWAERRLSPRSLAPARFARNLGASVLRTSPIVGVAAVLMGAWYLLDQTSLSRSFLDVALRLVGAATVGLIILTNHEGSSRFRTGPGLDAVVRRLVPEGRTTQRVVVGWVLATIVVAAALWLSPDPFPLP